MLLRLGNRRYDVTHRALVVGVLDRPDTADAWLDALHDTVSRGADLVCLRAADHAVACDELAAIVGAAADAVEVPLLVDVGLAGATTAAAAGANAVQLPEGAPLDAADGLRRQGVAVVRAAADRLVDGRLVPVATGSTLDPAAAPEGATAGLGSDPDRVGSATSPERRAHPASAGVARGASASGRAATGLDGVEVVEVDTLAEVGPLGTGVAVQFSALGDVDDPAQRRHDLAAVALAVSAGCRLIRTTDVAAARRVVDVLAAVSGARR